MKRSTIWDGGGRCRTHGEDLQRADPIEGKLGLEINGVDAFPGALANGGSGAVGLRPTVDGEWG